MIRLNKIYRGIYSQNYVDGLLANPDTLTAVLYRNNVATAVTVTITELSPGRHAYSFTTLGEGDGWAETDDISLLVTATIDAVPYPLWLWSSVNSACVIIDDTSTSLGTLEAISTEAKNNAVVAALNTTQ